MLPEMAFKQTYTEKYFQGHKGRVGQRGGSLPKNGSGGGESGLAKFARFGGRAGGVAVGSMVGRSIGGNGFGGLFGSSLGARIGANAGGALATKINNSKSLSPKQKKAAQIVIGAGGSAILAFRIAKALYPVGRAAVHGYRKAKANRAKYESSKPKGLGSGGYNPKSGGNVYTAPKGSYTVHEVRDMISSKAKKPKLGSGKRFAQLEAKVGSPALAAYIGRKKYGAKKMGKLAAHGKAAGDMGKCADCGKEMPKDKMTMRGGKMLCPKCANTMTKEFYATAEKAFFGHGGRPGQRGGSAPKGGMVSRVAGFAKKHPTAVKIAKGAVIAGAVVGGAALARHAVRKYNSEPAKFNRFAKKRGLNRVPNSPAWNRAKVNMYRAHVASGGKEVGSMSMKSFTQEDGNKRWVLIASGSFRDRDGEWLTEAALKEWADKFEATGNTIPLRSNGEPVALRWWHVGEPDPVTRSKGIGVDIGVCDFAAYHSKSLIMSGTYTDKEIGEAFERQAAALKASVGFFHPTDEPKDGEFHHIDVFEVSYLPKERASYPFTAIIA